MSDERSDNERRAATTAPDEGAPPSRRAPNRVWRTLRGVLIAMVLVGVAAGFAGTLWFLYQRSKGDPPAVK
ncbi:MAG TPA: hypothetical protein VL400_02020, partial [Polyangiaceae bacterium]|nr:hypothetical protein [Polyangiaceae bacterium]